MKTMAAAAFKARCLRVIKQMKTDREPVTITNRGRPVAMLSPLPPDEDKSLIGVLRGSVLGYDDPFCPATEASDWSATG
ncbi:MAG: type II toxin-antitoxin system prevent-host-death family antitoxin [Gammaproteobacteria bacterium]|nr:type II toxin-antitoxin system prevent-host-death family antitoxin [Gammaproteobacteria bacterium]